MRAIAICCPPLPHEYDKSSTTLRTDIQNYGLACARAAAVAALDEAAALCDARSTMLAAESAFDYCECPAVDDCAIEIRRLRDTIAKGES